MLEKNNNNNNNNNNSGTYSTLGLHGCYDLFMLIDISTGIFPIGTL